MAETTQAPRTEAEREAMVEAEAHSRCMRYGPLMGQPVPCDSCRAEAQQAIPPVSPAPALVSAEEWSRAYGQLIPRELVDRLLATLRHYEAEVGRLGDEVKAWDGTCQQAMQNWKTADVRRKEAEEALAREAPFAALGRAVARLARECEGTHFEGVKWTNDHPAVAAAVAALAEEKAKEPEVVTGGSGSKYRWRNGRVEQMSQYRDAKPPVWSLPFQIPIEDAPVVAALLKGVTP